MSSPYAIHSLSGELSRLAMMAEVEWTEARETVLRAVRARRIDAAFTSHSQNAHIKRIPSLDVDGQLERLARDESTGICLYSAPI